MTKTELIDPIELLQQAISQLRTTTVSAVSVAMLAPSLIKICQGVITDLKEHHAEDPTLEVICSYEKHVLTVAAIIVGSTSEEKGV